MVLPTRKPIHRPCKDPPRKQLPRAAKGKETTIAWKQPLVEKPKKRVVKKKQSSKKKHAVASTTPKFVPTSILKKSPEEETAIVVYEGKRK